MEDMDGEDSGTAPLPRPNQDASATIRAIVAMPTATHGAIVCALHGAGVAGAVSDVPHSWHDRDPGLTSASQAGQVVMTGVPQ